MARIEVLYRRTLSIETATPEDPKGGATLNISLPDTPILVLDAPRGPVKGGTARYTSLLDAPISAHNIITITSPELLNTAQPAAHVKKTTC